MRPPADYTYRMESFGKCILRTRKIKAVGGLATAMKHHLRERETPNADPSRRHLNIQSHSTSEAAISDYRKMMEGVKTRKNSVLAIEYMITASAETQAKMSEQQRVDYFNKAISWVYERHGKENRIFGVTHKDEKADHLHIIVAPIVQKLNRRGEPEKRLSARDFLGGREKLREMQTDFAEKVGRPVGLERGIQGSRAKHQTVQSYYTALQQPLDLKPVFPREVYFPKPFASKLKAVEETFDLMNAAYKPVLETLKAHTLKLENNQKRLKTVLEGSEAERKIALQREKTAQETLQPILKAIRDGDMAYLARVRDMIEERNPVKKTQQLGKEQKNSSLER